MSLNRVIVASALVAAAGLAGCSSAGRNFSCHGQTSIQIYGKGLEVPVVDPDQFRLITYMFQFFFSV